MMTTSKKTSSCFVLLCFMYVHCMSVYTFKQLNKSIGNVGPGLKPMEHTAPGQDIPTLTVYLGASDMESFLFRTSLTDMLTTTGPFTVFAPSNYAFFAISSYLRKTLFLNNQLLRELMRYHIIEGKLLIPHFFNEQLIPTLLPGHSIRFNIYKNNTVFTASGAVLSRYNQNATNGVISILNSVMTIPTRSIYSYIDVTSGFTVLRKVLKMADLVGLLNGTKPFTMFAPSDAAFTKLTADELEKLMSDEKYLTNVLAYHVINGTIYTAGFSNKDSIRTMNGQNLYIQIVNGETTVNGIELALPDISTTNGVIHIIDTLLIPH